MQGMDNAKKYRQIDSFTGYKGRIEVVFKGNLLKQ